MSVSVPWNSSFMALRSVLSRVTRYNAEWRAIFALPVNSNNNNNNQDDIYCAVVMAQSHCESSPGSILMNTDGAPDGCQPSDQANGLGH